MAVSYTHLDVYKRQLLQFRYGGQYLLCVFWHTANPPNARMSLIILLLLYLYFFLCQQPQGSCAVSYTHLDVYKRQEEGGLQITVTENGSRVAFRIPLGKIEDLGEPAAISAQGRAV